LRFHRLENPTELAAGAFEGCAEVAARRQDQADQVADGLLAGGELADGFDALLTGVDLPVEEHAAQFDGFVGLALVQKKPRDLRDAGLLGVDHGAGSVKKLLKALEL